MSTSVPLLQTSIQVAANDIFLTVVMAFVEQSSLALGLGKPEALRMTLASEELFLQARHAHIPESSPDSGTSRQAVFPRGVSAA